MFKHGFTQGNRLVIHTASDANVSIEEYYEKIKEGFKKAFADPRYEPGKTVIVGAHLMDNFLDDPEHIYDLAKALASGKPRKMSMIVYGHRVVIQSNFQLLKDFLKTMGVEFDWHYDLQGTLSEADDAS